MQGYSCGIKESSLSQDTSDICDANSSFSTSSRDTAVENSRVSHVTQIKLIITLMYSPTQHLWKATSKARQEIVQELRTLCLQHTR